MTRWDSPITELPGVGAVRYQAFQKLGLVTVGDLLQHYPRTYQYRGRVCALADSDPEKDQSYLLKVTTEPVLRRIPGKKLSLVTFHAADSTAVCELTFFNQPYLKNQIRVGATYRAFGKVIEEHGRKKMRSPALESVVPGKPLPDVLPLYPVTTGLTQKLVRDTVGNALASCLPSVGEWMPEEILRKESLCAFSYAIRQIHQPDDEEALGRAIKRLRYDEFLLFSLAVRLIRGSRQEENAPAFCDTDLSLLLAKFPFALTGAQDRAIADIVKDCRGNAGESIRPMARIVAGDVGSGKTAVAAAALYLSLRNGYQAAMMAPTEILATQHAGELIPLFESLGYRAALLTGSTTASEKKRIYEGLGSGEIRLVIGTHALLGNKVEFSRPGLFVTDEQHRFGVLQRAALQEKAEAAHVLVMSATPIPRTLALSLYGDLNISLLNEMPPGRQRVDTFVVDETFLPRVEAFIEKQTAEGHQVYVVCPAVEDAEEEEDEAPASVSDPPDLHSAVRYAEELESRHPDLKVAVLHGKMNGVEKDRVMGAFSAGEIQVLISTTVIEVGVNVPNATLMIVLNADRFGLSQLHQLRGRVGRGKDKAYCILISDATGETGRERLEIMRTTYDGFKIAERDLAMRGPGDFFANAGGLRQHGTLQFRFSGQLAESGELNRIVETAGRLLEESSDLSGYPLLKARVEEMTGHAENTIS